MIEERQFRLAEKSSAIARVSKCRGCAAALARARAFIVQSNGELFCDACGKIVCHELASIAERIEPDDARPDTDRFYAVVSGEIRANTLCPVTGQKVAPRAWEAAYSGDVKHLSPRGAAAAVPILGNALDAYFASRAGA